MFLRSALFSAGLSVALLTGGFTLHINPAIAQIIRPELRSGSTGTAVRELQTTLQLLNYYTGEVTGTYDEATVIAVYRFQKAAKLPETGITNQATWATLFPTEAVATSTDTTAPSATTDTAPAQNTNTSPSTASQAANQRTVDNLPLLREGMDGESVTFLQQRLKTKGFFPGTVDGVFGPQTLEAVIAAQTAFKLDGDGIVGYQTWKKLLE
ncbi:Peptidoglycan-binding domain 1 protein [[Leptolyngbya] sp. PCC 7376]|uniref:peptidoglycan-binding domain-containing protein n=1 Tax=[Leptolyngbya] sp. PCC 7376 TaxID=111781 RepID=UPI00029F402D|nr:peptidoglycan-binding protein [[Leptolyngbya] sp. PCC 7376]AFY38458.1 Peptidoglycan-binding domain 1 protein [[Leptolyngbya] sp. PCC 7376]